MDAAITYDEVAMLARVNIPSLEPHPNFEQIRVLRRHFEHALQCLPCPQSTFHRWKRMVMARELYDLLTPIPFRLSTKPREVPVYVQAVVAPRKVKVLDTAPLTRTELAMINKTFNCCKHYFLSMRNIKCACFTALDPSINDAFKVSNNLTIQGWHAGMGVMYILDQLSKLYGHPMPTVLETNNKFFASLMWLPMLPRSSFAALKIVPKVPCLGKIRTQIVNLLTM
jgi:hypothetical protein